MSKSPAELLDAYLAKAEDAIGADAVLDVVNERYRPERYDDVPADALGHDARGDLVEIAQAVHNGGVISAHDIARFNTCGNDACQRLARFLGERQ